MKIGLVDVDGHNFPNLPLMKLSAYHKNKGDSVEFVNLFNSYDCVYQSKVFTFSEDFLYPIKTDRLIKGGTGYGLNDVLSKEIENIYPDYSLYSIDNTAYGFLTRGCPRHCSFCIVGDKEGLKSVQVADIDQFYRGQREIILLDPNLLACKDRIELLNQLINTHAYIDFSQGLDIRLMDDEIAYLIKDMRIKILHFAWDNMKDSDIILKNLKLFKNITDFNFRKQAVYVLVNYDTTMEENLYRIYKIKELGYDPYVMVYDKKNAPKEIRQLQRWVNNKYVFRSGKVEHFEDYKKATC